VTDTKHNTDMNLPCMLLLLLHQPMLTHTSSLNNANNMNSNSNSAATLLPPLTTQVPSPLLTSLSTGGAGGSPNGHYETVGLSDHRAYPGSLDRGPSGFDRSVSGNGSFSNGFGSGSGSLSGSLHGGLRGSSHHSSRNEGT
jgi:hypothetical protein